MSDMLEMQMSKIGSNKLSLQANPTGNQQNEVLCRKIHLKRQIFSLLVSRQTVTFKATNKDSVAVKSDNCQ